MSQKSSLDRSRSSLVRVLAAILFAGCVALIASASEPRNAAATPEAAESATASKRAQKPRLRLVAPGRWKNPALARMTRKYSRQVRVRSPRPGVRALRLLRRMQKTARKRSAAPVALVIDTRGRKPRRLARNRLVRTALNGGSWLITLNAGARRRNAAFGKTGTRTHGPSWIGAARVGTFERGRPLVEALQFIAPRSARAKARVVSPYARLLFRSLTRGPVAVSGSAVTASGEGSAPPVPASMLTARWRIATVSAPRLGWPSRNDPPSEAHGRRVQQPVVSTTQTFTAYLSNETKVSPGGPEDGPSQYIYYELDGQVSPIRGPGWKDDFIADPQAPNWKGDRGWWTAGVDASIEPPSGVRLLKSAPSTPNSVTQYTSGTSFSIGFSANAGKATGVAAGSNIGAAVNASYGWNDSTTREIPDWGVRSKTAGSTGAWSFYSKSPCDYSGGVKSIVANEGPRSCFAAARDTGWIGNHQKPLPVNDLSASSMDFHANALWQTDGLKRGTLSFIPQVDATMAFTWWNSIRFDDHPPNKNFARSCPFRCKIVQTRQIDGLQAQGGPDRINRVDLNLGAIVPVPIRSITYHDKEGSPALDADEPIWISRSTNQKSIAVCVTLEREAPATLRLPVGSTNLDNFYADGTMTIPMGQTRGCYPLSLKGNRLAQCEAITAETGTFYAAPEVRPITIRSGTPERCEDD